MTSLICSSVSPLPYVALASSSFHPATIAPGVLATALLIQKSAMPDSKG
jgi:hypothetical protein